MSNLQPINIKKSILVEGTVLYNDGRRRIDIKRPFTDILENMAESNKVVYAMEMYLCKDKFMEKIEEAVEDGVLPILLWFKKMD